MGVLAGILDSLKSEGHNIQEMENIIFKGGTAACARIFLVVYFGFFNRSFRVQCQHLCLFSVDHLIFTFVKTYKTKTVSEIYHVYTRTQFFSAGPAVLPLEVIEELQQALPNYNGIGLGLMEMSHRSKDFDDIIHSAIARLRSLVNIPEDYEVLLLQGGASLQFYMTALNLLGPEDTGAYINTGTWSTKAIKEAKRCAKVETVWEPSTGIFNGVPTDDEYTVSDKAQFLHYTSNNTIYGTQFQTAPTADVPLVGDYSSDIASAPIDVSKHGVIYAGAQKNLGPVVVYCGDSVHMAVERSAHVEYRSFRGLPSMLNYKLMVEKNSMFNTPNTFWNLCIMNARLVRAPTWCLCHSRTKHSKANRIIIF